MSILYSIIFFILHILRNLTILQKQTIDLLYTAKKKYLGWYYHIKTLQAIW